MVGAERTRARIARSILSVLRAAHRTRAIPATEPDAEDLIFIGKTSGFRRACKPRIDPASAALYFRRSMNPRRTPIDRAAKAVGGQARLAALLGLSRMAVSGWVRRGVPAGRVLSVEKLTGVSRHDLRPDLYPRERRARA